MKSLLFSLLVRLQNIAIALDQFLFVLICLGGVYPDETASSAAWRLEIQGRWQGRYFRPAIDLLFSPFQKDHCRKAYESEKLRLQAPEDQR